jgi:hypothetical protein
VTLPGPLSRLVIQLGELGHGEPPPLCENCGVPTWDWRSVGWYCSDACKDEDALKITL